MKTLAKALAIASGLMFLLPFGFYLLCDINYNFTEYATFVGGTAGPMAALAGFLFIYLTFQHQQEQLDNHDKQFERQSFENTFFNLLNYYRELSANFTFDFNGTEITMDEFKEHVNDSIGLVSPIKANLKNLQINTTGFSVEDTAFVFRARFHFQKKDVQQLIKPLLSIAYHILTYDKKSQRKYFTILISQIPDSYLYVYFYFYIAYCESSFSWLDRRIMYRFLSKIRIDILIAPVHKEWIEKAPYKPKTQLSEHNKIPDVK